MAEALEIEVKFDGIGEAIQSMERLIRELEKTTRGLQDTGESSEKTGKKLDDTSKSTAKALTGFQRLAKSLSDTKSRIVEASFAFNQVKSAADSVFGTIGRVVGAVSDAAAEFEEIIGVTNRFSGDVSEAAQRTNGLISELNLMRASNRLTQAGLRLSATEMANLSVAAAETAAATGGDTVDALNTLTDTLINAEEGGARRFGISLQGITDVADRQQAIVRQLGNRYGDIESSADSAAGGIAVLSNRIEDIKLDFAQAVEQSGQLDDALERLAGSFGQLAGAIAEDEDSTLSAVERLGIRFDSTVAVMAESVARQVDEIRLSFEQIGAFVSGTEEDLERVNRQLRELRSQPDLDNFTGGFELESEISRRAREAEQRINDQRRLQSAQSEGNLLGALGLGGIVSIPEELDQAAREALEGGGNGGGNGGGRGGRGGRRNRAAEELLELKRQQQAIEAKIAEENERSLEAILAISERVDVDAELQAIITQDLQRQAEAIKERDGALAAQALFAQNRNADIDLLGGFEDSFDAALAGPVADRADQLRMVLEEASRIRIQLEDNPDLLANLETTVGQVEEVIEALEDDARERALQTQALISQSVEGGYDALVGSIRAVVSASKKVQAEAKKEIKLRKEQGASQAEIAKLEQDAEKAAAQARREAIKGFLKDFAIQNALAGGQKIAEGIGELPSPTALLKFKSAGIHFAMAAAAGGASAAIPAGDAAAASGGTGAGTGAAAPIADNNDDDEIAGQTFVINFNAPRSDAEMGRDFENAERAASRRFGERRGNA